MFLLCAAFFTLTEAICDPAGAMLAQMLHPQGAIVALETSTGNHLGWLSETSPAFTVPVYFRVGRVGWKYSVWVQYCWFDLFLALKEHLFKQREGDEAGLCVAVPRCGSVLINVGSPSPKRTVMNRPDIHLQSVTRPVSL